MKAIARRISEFIAAAYDPAEKARRILAKLRPDYMDGQWHIWRSGARPVGPDVLVDGLVMVEGDEPSRITAPARVFDWSHQNDPLVAFRVVRSRRHFDPEA